MKLSHIEKMLDRLPELVVELDPNPVSRGPLYLQEIISKVRGMLNETGVYLQEVLRCKSALESQLEAKEVDFQISSDELLANDQRVTHLPAVQDRQAMINVILRDRRKEVLELRKQVNDIGYVERAVRHRHRELESTMSAVRLQRSLIQTELRTGSYFGDEGETSRGEGTWGRRPPSKDDDLDESQVSRIFDNLEDEDEDGDEEVVGESVAAEDAVEEEVTEDPPAAGGSVADDFGLGDEDMTPRGPTLYCSVCGEPQTDTPHGLVCKNGHGGANSVEAPTRRADSDVGLDETDLPDAEGDQDVSNFLGEDPVSTNPVEDVEVEEDDFSDIFDQIDKGL